MPEEDYSIPPLALLAEQLRREGFEARDDIFAGQSGLLLGPKGLDPARMTEDQTTLFFPNWEWTDPANQERVAAREFHEIFENRPSDWKLSRRS